MLEQWRMHKTIYIWREKVNNLMLQSGMHGTGKINDEIPV